MRIIGRKKYIMRGIIGTYLPTIYRNIICSKADSIYNFRINVDTFMLMNIIQAPKTLQKSLNIQLICWEFQ